MMMNEDKNKTEKSIEDLMKTATEDSQYEADYTGSQKKKGPSMKVIASFLIGIVVFGGLLTLGALKLKGNDEFVDKTETPDWISKGNSDSFVNSGVSEMKKPVELHDWAQVSYSSDLWEIEDIEEDILNVSKEDYKSFHLAIFWLNSGLEQEHEGEFFSTPYTNDISKRLLDDEETTNPKYSYALKEDYEKAYVLYVERLLNPTFGGWANAQTQVNGKVESNMSFQKLKDMFSIEWWTNNVEQGDFSSLPVFAEWKEDNWDKYDLYTKDNMYSGLFYGKVVTSEDENSILVENMGFDEEKQNILKVTSPVEFYSFNNSGKKNTVRGTLELTLQSNTDYLDIANRVIINDAKLSIDE